MFPMKKVLLGSFRLFRFLFAYFINVYRNSQLNTVHFILVSIKIPRLNLLSSPEVRQPGKAPNYSVNWTTSIDNFDVQIDNTNDDNELEIIDAMKGKKQVNILSQLS